MTIRYGSTSAKNREEWVIDKLHKLKPGIKILDAGAGECLYREHCKHLKYYSQDSSDYTGFGDKKGLQTGKWDYSKIDIVSDIVSIPVPDKSFDVILCTEVFEHISDPIAAIKEFSRILKPRGVLITTSPFVSITHFSPMHFYSGFNKYFYETIYPKYGFKITEITTSGDYFEFIAQELLRLPSVMEKYTKIRFGKIFRLSQIIILYVLKKCSAERNSSNDLLNFGFYVVSKKQSRYSHRRK